MDIKNNEEKSQTQTITYYLISSGCASKEKTICINSYQLQKTVLLYIYYWDMLKIKARTGDVIQAIIDWLFFQCYQAENVVTKNKINVPFYEACRILAQMYAKELIDSIEDKDGSYFVLKELGRNICKEYLINNNS